MINNCIKKLQHIFYSSSCLLCGQAAQLDTNLCAACTEEMPYNPSACRCCALPLNVTEQLFCGHCQKTPPAYQYSFIPFCYTLPINRFIQNFKFKHDLISGKLLADLFLQNLPINNHPDVLIPVPLHPSRLKQRGYNQALWLARRISQSLNLPIDQQIIRRHKNTSPQHQLNAKSRLNNIKNAFSLTKPCRYQKVAIVDDVVTTGTTVNEIATLLKSAGVKEIQIWAIARTSQAIKS